MKGLLLFFVFFIGWEIEAEDDVNLQSIREVIKNDMLEAEVTKKRQIKQKKKRKIRKRQIRKYNIPNEKDFWNFMSEYWLVKNAVKLKWDFEKPDYGFDQSFSFFLEKMKIHEKRFRILMTDSLDVFHMALPGNGKEMIFILSRPFIKDLNLSKLEVSLLLFEDYLRFRQGYFMSYLKKENLKGLLGGNFYKKKLDRSKLKNVMMRYDSMIFKKGFSFQQQYQTTKMMDELLRYNKKIWNVYVSLLKKIDNLVKSNPFYKRYNKIYPSPELQINWLYSDTKR